VLEIADGGKENVTAVPGIALRLENVFVAKPAGRFFGFEEKLSLAVDAEGIVGPPVRFALFFEYFAKIVGNARIVAHVPAERFEKRCDELRASLRFVVLR